jgi:hypothetical protein
MQRVLIAAAMLTIAFDCAAQARTRSEDRPVPGVPARVVGAPPTAASLALVRWRRGLQPGMVVVDRYGARVGVIAQTNQTDDGRPAIVLLVNGTPVSIPASEFRPVPRGEEAVVSLTPSELRTEEILNGD